MSERILASLYDARLDDTRMQEVLTTRRTRVAPVKRGSLYALVGSVGVGAARRRSTPTTRCPRPRTLAAGETAGTVTVTVTDDAEDDDGETIVIDAESTSPALTAEPLTLTIEDNAVTPVPALPLRGVLLLGLLLTLLGAVRMRMRERTDIARGC